MCGDGYSFGRRNQAFELFSGSGLFGTIALYTDGCIDNAHQILCLREVDQDFEQEAIELGFWQGIGAFHFERVLCCQDEEWFGKWTCAITYANRALLHAFEQGRLCLWRGTVHLVGKHDVGKNGSWLEAENAPASM